MKYFPVVFLFVIILFSSCQKDKKYKEVDKTFVLPQIIYEEEEVTVYAIEDSIEIEKPMDSLFFRVYILMQDLSDQLGYVKIKDGKASFNIPKGAAYLIGNFYNKNGLENRTYERAIYSRSTNKEVVNAHQLSTTEEKMNRELYNYPNNLAIYAKYIQNKHEDVYMGKISDSIFQIEVKKYLSIVEQKVNTESASEMYSLIVLSTYAKEYDKAKKLLLEMMEKHSNSNFFKEAYNSYWIWSKMYRENPKKTDDFIDSLDKHIAKNLPHTPIGMISSIAPAKMKYYTPEITAENAKYQLEKIDSTNSFTLMTLVRAKLRIDMKNILEAKTISLNYLKDMKREKWKILTPTEPKNRNGLAKKGSYIGVAYQLLAEVSDAEKDYKQAINYLDSAYMSYQTDRQNNFIKNPITDALNLKASIQKKINQQDKALKTYETLYQETKDDRVLDSIKVLFKETQQEKGFESYAKNLKERVENENTAPKKLAADFSIKDMSGYEIKLSEWKGRVVVLNFWANYCLPCAKEIPYLNKIWRETQTKEIIFLAVTKNTPIEVTRFAQRQKEMFSFSILPNAKELADVYDVNLVPTTIVINKKGEIVHQESGFSGNIDKLKQVILEELNK